ncbi:uncharacterized protein LOC142014737 [Carettochelys insculpta]|uniref:uncharacterized protein LOC142014737 n=1 Tax=Carettochelys insculpta TaxID=44489 RepID=UPI003EB7C865
MYICHCGTIPKGHEPGLPFIDFMSTTDTNYQQRRLEEADARRKPKQVWICGHSYVFWAEKRALSRSFGPQLGIRVEDAKLHWIGKSGMMWDQLIPTLLNTRKLLPDPDVLVIHLGGNDLGKTKLVDILIRTRKDLKFIHETFKNVILVWSDIVPRKAWNQEESYKCLERSRRRVNRAIGKFMKSIGGYVISHDSLVPESPGLFHLDGVLLSQSGTDVFNLDLLSVLETLI